MEPRRSRADARWFLHAQGHTLGPYDDQRVLKGIEDGEILPSDKIYSAKDGTWTILSSHPYFQSRPELLAFRRAEQLPSPPSPRKLRSKAANPPPIPALPPKPAPSMDPLLPSPELPRMHSPVITHVEPLPEPEPLPLTTHVHAEPEPRPAEEKGLFEEVSFGPREVVHIEPLVLTQAVVAPPVATVAPVSEEIVKEESLEDMARALERALDQTPAPRPSEAAAPMVDAQIPPRPEIKPVFLSEPGSWAQAPRSAPEPPRVIQIQLKMPEKPLHKLTLFVLVVLLAVAAGYAWSSFGNKTRDQKDFRLSDPSSPIAAPIEAVDPNPPLKAPTRPQRE